MLGGFNIGNHRSFERQEESQKYTYVELVYLPHTIALPVAIYGSTHNASFTTYFWTGIKEVG